MKSVIGPGTVVSVRVPATSANLGPGFDCLALSLSLYNDISVEVLPAGSTGLVSISGEGAQSLGTRDTNLVIDAMERFALDRQRELPPVRLTMRNEIPLGRGLGSSAAAIAGGTMAAALLLGARHDPEALLPVGLEMEGHPDNIVAALWEASPWASWMAGRRWCSAWRRLRDCAPSCSFRMPPPVRPNHGLPCQHVRLAAMRCSTPDASG